MDIAAYHIERTKYSFLRGFDKRAQKSSSAPSGRRKHHAGEHGLTRGIAPAL
jgi:hypothetical protein